MGLPVKAIVFDIDGTLADLTHRRHLVTKHPKDWPEFFKQIPGDSVINQTRFLNNLIKKHGILPILLASGRSEKERADTEEWLKKHHINYDKLYMRPAGDYRKDTIIKREILDHMRSDGYEPWLIFDDRECVTEMWRKEGLFVLQCDPNPHEVLHDSYMFHENVKFPLTLMVGPAGAGKSTWIESHVFAPDMILSSDSIRYQLCGTIKDQSRNEDVFEAMHTLAKERLKRGLPVILDATHLRNADRIKAAKLLPESLPVRYVVVNRSLAEKKRDGGWRNEVMIKDKTLIEKHDQTFKSNLKAILSGDGLPNVTVVDIRTDK